MQSAKTIEVRVMKIYINKEFIENRALIKAEGVITSERIDEVHIFFDVEVWKFDERGIKEKVDEEQVVTYFETSSERTKLIVEI